MKKFNHFSIKRLHREIIVLIWKYKGGLEITLKSLTRSTVTWPLFPTESQTTCIPNIMLPNTLFSVFGVVSYSCHLNWSECLSPNRNNRPTEIPLFLSAHYHSPPPRWGRVPNNCKYRMNMHLGRKRCVRASARIIRRSVNGRTRDHARHWFSHLRCNLSRCIARAVFCPPPRPGFFCFKNRGGGWFKFWIVM